MIGVCLNAKTDTFENASHSFVNKLLTTMAFKVTIGTLLAANNKRLCLEKGINSTFFLLEQCERAHGLIAYLFETEQCERATFSSTKADRNENGAV